MELLYSLRGGGDFSPSPLFSFCFDFTLYLPTLFGAIFDDTPAPVGEPAVGASPFLPDYITVVVPIVVPIAVRIVMIVWMITCQMFFFIAV